MAGRIHRFVVGCSLARNCSAVIAGLVLAAGDRSRCSLRVKAEEARFAGRTGLRIHFAVAAVGWKSRMRLALDLDFDTLLLVDLVEEVDRSCLRVLGSARFAEAEGRACCRKHWSRFVDREEDSGGC